MRSLRPIDSLRCASRRIGPVLAIMVAAATLPPSPPTRSVIAAELPEWAYPVEVAEYRAVGRRRAEAGSRAAPGNSRRRRSKTISTRRTGFPEDHPADARTWSRTAARPAVSACAKCHISNGAGHPGIVRTSAGLPAAYVQEQFEQYKNGDRRGARAMSMLPVDRRRSPTTRSAAAADYYAAL